LTLAAQLRNGCIKKWWMESWSAGELMRSNIPIFQHPETEVLTVPRMIDLTTPFTEEKVRALKVGDAVEISGILFTGRDAVHKYLHDGGALPPGVNLRDGIIYHCGPVVLKDERGGWQVTAAGPTTSIREEPYQGQIIKQFGLRAVIGKGGMGDRTLAACQECGCVYLHAVGGAAQVLAECIKKVRNVYFYEKFGAPEAIWEFEVEDFPAVVTMDAHGNSLHREVFAKSQAELAKRL
jgi:tartrate/fumarate subfamily iron-sulfur-dependent hydro-lyase beta chain